MFAAKRRSMRSDKEIISVEERSGLENAPNLLLNDGETFVFIHNTIFFSTLQFTLLWIFFFTLMMAFALHEPSTEGNQIVTMTID